MQSIAQGNLTETLPENSKGEIQKLNTAINQSIYLLGSTLEQVSNSSTRVASSAEQLTTSAQALASGSANQASDLEETSTALSEVEMQTQSNSENAMQARLLSSQILSVVDESNE